MRSTNELSTRPTNDPEIESPIHSLSADALAKRLSRNVAFRARVEEWTRIPIAEQRAKAASICREEDRKAS